MFKIPIKYVNVHSIYAPYALLIPCIPVDNLSNQKKLKKSAAIT